MGFFVCGIMFRFTFIQFDDEATMKIFKSIIISLKEIVGVFGLLFKIRKNFEDMEKKEPGLTTKFKLRK